MKRIVLFLLFITHLTTKAEIQTVASVELRVQHVDEGIINVTIPVNHIVFWGASRVDTVRAGKPHFIPLTEQQTGFVYMEVFGRIVRLFVQKGDHIKVLIDEEDEKAPFRIEGNNHEGQLALSQNELPYVGNLINRYKNDTTAALLAKHVEEDKQVRVELFRVLYSQKKIDEAFYNFAMLTLQYYHATLLSEIIYSKFNVTLLPKEHPQHIPVFPAQWGQLWEQVYKNSPVNNQAALQTFGYSDGFNTYAGNYISGYLSWLKNRYGTGNGYMGNWSAEIREMLQRIQNNLSAPVAEFTEASMLYAELSLEKNYGELLKLTDSYRKKYPQSPYLPYMQKLVDKAVAYEQTVNKDFTQDQKFVPDYARINTFAELMQHFKGKPVYIEFWASWCYTCKDQFDYQQELNKYLDKKGITHLFISVDHQNAVNEWQDLIKVYDLKGFHVRANPSLIKSLSAIFWDGKGYALPLYAIMTAGGKIANDDAMKPADRKRLYQQLESALQ